MKSSYWYIALALLSVLVFILALWKKRDQKLVALYLFLGGLTYTFEYFVFVLFNSYIYYPGILENEYFDNALGAAVSNAFSVPMTSVLVAAYQLNYIYMLIPIISIIGIELLFLHLGIYKHLWWHEIYTIIGLFMAFHIAKWWYKVLTKPLKDSSRFITLLVSGFFLQGSFAFILYGIFSKYFYTVNWFSDITRSHIAFATVYVVLFSIIFSAFIVIKLNWIFIIITVFLTSVPDMVLLNLGILSLSNDWTLGHFIVSRFIVFLLLFLCNRFLLKPAASSR